MAAIEFAGCGGVRAGRYPGVYTSLGPRVVAHKAGSLEGRGGR
jgi:hypothetical protein